MYILMHIFLYVRILLSIRVLLEYYRTLTL